MPRSTTWYRYSWSTDGVGDDRQPLPSLYRGLPLDLGDVDPETTSIGLNPGQTLLRTICDVTISCEPESTPDFPFSWAGGTLWNLWLWWFNGFTANGTFDPSTASSVETMRLQRPNWDQDVLWQQSMNPVWSRPAELLSTAYGGWQTEPRTIHIDVAVSRTVAAEADPYRAGVWAFAESKSEFNTLLYAIPLRMWISGAILVLQPE